MRRLLIGSVLATLVATAAAAALAVGAIGGAKGGGAEAAAEGIQVHGHWTIEVRDPDGTVTSTRKFDNALTSWGRRDLVKLLTGAVMGRWSVVLDAQPPEGRACRNADGLPRGCRITETHDFDSGPEVFKNLVVVHLNNVTVISLEGTAVAQADGLINEVETRFGTCPTSFSSDTCRTAAGADVSSAPFTSHVLAAAQPVRAGQQILVTVEISFS